MSLTSWKYFERALYVGGVLPARLTTSQILSWDTLRLKGHSYGISLQDRRQQLATLVTNVIAYAWKTFARTVLKDFHSHSSFPQSMTHDEWQISGYLYDQSPLIQMQEMHSAKPKRPAELWWLKTSHPCNSNILWAIYVGADRLDASMIWGVVLCPSRSNPNCWAGNTSTRVAALAAHHLSEDQPPCEGAVWNEQYADHWQKDWSSSPHPSRRTSIVAMPPQRVPLHTKSWPN